MVHTEFAHTLVNAELSTVRIQFGGPSELRMVRTEFAHTLVNA